LKTAQAKSSRKTLHKNKAGGVAQGPEFKPQYHKKKKKKKKINFETRGCVLREDSDSGRGRGNALSEWLGNFFP
jgi:hypothetical protein